MPEDLIELAKASAEINKELGITPDDLIEALMGEMLKIPGQLQLMVDSVVAMHRGDFPMPQEGWDAFVASVQYTNEKHGLNLEI